MPQTFGRMALVYLVGDIEMTTAILNTAGFGCCQTSKAKIVKSIGLLFLCAWKRPAAFVVCLVFSVGCERLDDRGSLECDVYHWVGRDIDRLKEQLREGCDPNVKNELGFTPLHLAANYGLIEDAAILIDNGADVNAQDNAGNTPIHFAAYEDEAEMVDFLVDASAELDIRNDRGDTPLHRAVRAMGPGAAARTLLDAGASPDARNNRGRTPIFHAVDIRRTHLVSALLHHGASIDVIDKDGTGVLDIARDEDKEWIVRIKESVESE